MIIVKPPSFFEGGFLYSLSTAFCGQTRYGTRLREPRPPNFQLSTNCSLLKNVDILFWNPLFPHRILHSSPKFSMVDSFVIKMTDQEFFDILF